MRRLLIALPLLAALAGCAQQPNYKHYDMTYSDAKTIDLAVADITVSTEYNGMRTNPVLAADMPISLENAIRDWASARLRAVGTEGQITVSIVDAHVESVNDKDGEGYRARAELHFQGMTWNDRTQYYTNVVATRTVYPGMFTKDNGKVLQQMTELLMKDLDAELDKNIRQYMAKLVRN